VKDGDHGQRWGTGEARVEKMEVLDAAGAPAKRIRTGHSVTFRFHYQTTERIERPVFGMGVTRLDGVDVTGPNTRDAKMIPPSIDGTGYVDHHVERLL